MSGLIFDTKKATCEKSSFLVPSVRYSESDSWRHPPNPPPRRTEGWTALHSPAILLTRRRLNTVAFNVSCVLGRAAVSETAIQLATRGYIPWLVALLEVRVLFILDLSFDIVEAVIWMKRRRRLL